MTAIIIIAIVAILVLWVISVQRKLVKQEEICKNGLSQIGVQLASRWDALKALAELTKGYSEHEYKTITDTIAQRRPITAASSSADANAQENLFNEALGRLNLVVERYPELKANETYIKTMDSVNTYQNQVRMSQMVYNDSVTKFNQLIRQFPDSIVASLFHFTPREYLEQNQDKAEMPSMKL
ncbi:MAG: LemA family protein [Bacteroidales bacterium]|jgi:LemA protein|nr:LemA family protein [Bacteroidales bacterium]MBQ1636915.1 LemA family protein [Bacteroidales bacterium]MBQ1753672.1 LemA family protein [Bacteroidales bacterium]MBQ1831579.1 LemA family protein [Bacteroidales bacterium]MBQ2149189.1 LemA family protein [Bacteroidales bacterium]